MWRDVVVEGGPEGIRADLSVAFLPGNLTTNGHVPGNPPSKQAEDFFNQRFPPTRTASTS